MNPFVFDSSTSKAVAAGIVGALVAVGAHYGFQPSATTISAVGVLVTAVVGYLIGHIAVWLSPANKPKI